MKTLFIILLISMICIGCSNPIAVVDKGNANDAVSFLREYMIENNPDGDITFGDVQVNQYSYDWGTDYHIRQEYTIDYSGGLSSGGVKDVHVEYLISTQEYKLIG